MIFEDLSGTSDSTALVSLVWDTSTAITSLACIVPHYRSFMVRTWSEANASQELVPAIEKMLSALALSTAQVKRLIVGMGPGSFTGLRVGWSTAKGLAAGLGVAQLHGVCSLAAMAHTAAGLELLQGYVVVVLLRARMGCCVAGVFAWKEAQMRALLPVGTYALSDEHLQAYLEAQERVIVVTTLQDKAFFQEQWPKHTCLWQAGYPSAWALYTLWQSGMFSQQEQVKALLPFYSRKPVAQPLWATAAPSPVS